MRKTDARRTEQVHTKGTPALTCAFSRVTSALAKQRTGIPVVKDEGETPCPHPPHREPSTLSHHEPGDWSSSRYAKSFDRGGVPRRPLIKGMYWRSLPGLKTGHSQETIAPIDTGNHYYHAHEQER